ncbi:MULTISPECIES: dihydroorotate dehydrogenase [Clostridium]|uniref:dihydrouracil dehydrogenase (NAD(+)) n=1 Tax=Clostridium botulinum TaxID=1491 RepID=A0ABD7CG44_CLOBO|nr:MULTISPECIES: dihydroorotate dehydrogenase [Clostridium]KGO15606.1 dihydroorotate dehydrogenase [Clostridium botulinum]KOY66160.1 dihydroorotate dehydrogenase [Clostridium sporogenes]MDS1006398.1 dihydroorotate dehydrogenase [Clostridium sporogenes]QRI52006.1 dihydroorotate dehydrogenase [Clostridium botulinum]
MKNDEKINPLQTEVLGMKLKNPVIIASSNLTDNEKSIRKFLDLGVGAVITKTIYIGEKNIQSGRILRKESQIFNSTTYSKKSISEWTEILSKLYKENLPVIPSIVADTKDELVNLALQMEEVGCKALELGISCPNEIGINEKIYDFTRAVCREVSVPVSVKLTSEVKVEEKVRKAMCAGAKSVSISDSIPAIVVNTDGTLPLGVRCGYSGPAIKPIVQKNIYYLKKNNADVEVIGIGGIENANDVLEYLYVGSSAVELCSCIFINGINQVEKIIHDLKNMFLDMGITVPEIINKALKD